MPRRVCPCSCGKLLCIDGPDDVICPWCETGLSFSNDGGNTNFDVKYREEVDVAKCFT
ncbi:TerY-C metal binding domain-containing protein [Escherichia coli]